MNLLAPSNQQQTLADLKGFLLVGFAVKGLNAVASIATNYLAI